MVCFCDICKGGSVCYFLWYAGGSQTCSVYSLVPSVFFSQIGGSLCVFSSSSPRRITVEWVTLWHGHRLASGAPKVRYRCVSGWSSSGNNGPPWRERESGSLREKNKTWRPHSPATSHDRHSTRSVARGKVTVNAQRLLREGGWYPLRPTERERERFSSPPSSPRDDRKKKYMVL